MIGSTTVIASIVSNSRLNVVLIGAVIGGVAGSLLVLTVLLLLLALVWMTKKKAARETQYNLDHRRTQSDVIEQRVAVQQEHQDDEAMEMKNNDAYVSTTQQIPTEDNVAYGQIESNCSDQ